MPAPRPAAGPVLTVVEPMRVRLKKGRDGQPTLACHRPDGTATWGKVNGFFPVHDLTHYAVETTLGFRAAFFGLVASGWTLEDFEAPGAADRMPPEALVAEHIVGLLDQERAAGVGWSAAQFNDALTLTMQKGACPPFRRLTDGELTGIRALRGELTQRWAALSPGETLELLFPPRRG